MHTVALGKTKHVNKDRAQSEKEIFHVIVLNNEDISGS
jgi:hypothetical protein